MKAQELRIGNYYDNNGQTETVTVSVIEALLESESRAWIKPIPITEEWLVKFGFKLTSDSGDVKHFDFPNNSDYSIYLDHKDIALAYNTKSGYYCLMYDVHYLQSVHQLQNIFYALTGEELTINN